MQDTCADPYFRAHSAIVRVRHVRLVHAVHEARRASARDVADVEAVPEIERLLGGQYGEVLERGELQLFYADGAFGVRYFDHVFPLGPRGYAEVLRLRLDEPAFGVARGQAAVLYDGDLVVGSGLVTSAASE